MSWLKGGHVLLISKKTQHITNFYIFAIVNTIRLMAYALIHTNDTQYRIAYNTKHTKYYIFTLPTKQISLVLILSRSRNPNEKIHYCIFFTDTQHYFANDWMKPPLFGAFNRVEWGAYVDDTIDKLWMRSSFSWMPFVLKYSSHCARSLSSVTCVIANEMNEIAHLQLSIHQFAHLFIPTKGFRQDNNHLHRNTVFRSAYGNWHGQRGVRAKTW